MRKLQRSGERSAHRLSGHGLSLIHIYSTEWLRSELVEGKPYFPNMRPGDRFDVAPEDVDAIMKCVDYWEGKSLYEALRRSLPQEINEAWDANVIDDTWVSGAGLGNEVVDYNLVVTKGLEDVMDRIRARLAELDPKEPGNIRKIWFLQAALQGNEAVVNFSNRIAAECARQAEACQDAKRKAELGVLAEICRHVPLHPARTCLLYTSRLPPGCLPVRYHPMRRRERI